MSEENVEIVRRVIKAFETGLERGDPGAAWDTGLVAERLGVDNRDSWAWALPWTRRMA
jgi:hypothetical protein